MLTKSLPLALAALAALFAPLSVADTALPEVDAVFAEYDRPDVPGCALGVIRDGEFAYRRGYGAANLEYGLPITADSVFRIGSTSKQFTAAAILLLAQSGELDLDAPLRRLFPEFPEWAEGITVRQLVHHTSGIRDYLQLAYLAGKADDADYYTDAWVLELLARQGETNFPPGSEHLYSNSGYLLLAHAVQRVTGKSLREFAAERLFAPLGMQISHFHDDHTDIVPGRASGYAPEDDGFRLSMTTLDMVGDGGVFTTVNELLAWDRNFYDNRLGGGQAFVTAMQTPGQLADGTPLTYAFGLDVEDYRGLRMIGHGGAFVGYRADMIRFPEPRLSVIVLCNRADAAPGRLARQVADRLLADRLEPAPGAAEPGEAPAEPWPMEPGQLAEYAGDYWEDDEAFAAEARVEDDKLWAVHSPTRRNELVPVEPDHFVMVGVPAVVHVYFDREGGRITGMRRTINGTERGRFRPFQRRETNADELAAYAGSYYSPELDVTYPLTVEDGVLWFRPPNQAAQELTAMFGETFENPDYGAFEFRRGPDGAVSGFSLQSGRVRNLAFGRRP